MLQTLASKLDKRGLILKNKIDSLVGQIVDDSTAKVVMPLISSNINYLAGLSAQDRMVFEEISAATEGKNWRVFVQFWGDTFYPLKSLTPLKNGIGSFFEPYNE